jgi:lysophospholipase L1-like esterase
MVDPKPLEMTMANPSVYLWDKILTNLKDADVLVYTNPVNQALLSPWVNDPGYQANVQRIDTFFKGEPAKYVNWEKAMPDSLFADHVHLTPEGYKKLAAMIGEQLLGSTKKYGG